MEVTRLPEFATEQQNPENAKRVTRITMTLPASNLQDSVSFVDTPGFGSLASIQRKIGALRESVISSLEMQLERSKKPNYETGDQVRAAEARWRRATGSIEEARSAWEKDMEGLQKDLSEALYAISAGLIQAWSEEPGLWVRPALPYLDQRLLCGSERNLRRNAWFADSTSNLEIRCTTH